LLLETYTDAEKSSRKQAAEQVAAAFEAKMLTVVGEIDRSARKFVETAGQISVWRAIRPSGQASRPARRLTPAQESKPWPQRRRSFPHRLARSTAGSHNQLPSRSAP
jgi:hypothetical protein